MSRLAKKPIKLPANVEVKVNDNNEVTVKGPLGALSVKMAPSISVEIKEGEIMVNRASDAKQDKAFHGLYWSLLRNFIEGVTKGFEKQLKLEGVGYRAEVKGQIVKLSVGFSHDVVFVCPPEVTPEYDKKRNLIVLKSIDKALLGHIAASIRKIRPPEPYKGKGIRYADEHVILKETKGAK